MSPDELGRLTYGQFLDMFEGWKYARKMRMQENAQHAAWVMTPHTKRPVKPSDLLKVDKPKIKTTAEKSNALITQMMAEVGGDIEWQQ